MSFDVPDQGSSGKLFDERLLSGTSSPNGKIWFLEKSQVPRLANWRVKFGSPLPRRLQDIRLTASPQYPYGIEIYSPGRISLGKTAELCGLHYDEIIEEIKRRGLHFNFGPRSLEEAKLELESVRRHIRKRP